MGLTVVNPHSKTVRLNSYMHRLYLCSECLSFFLFDFFSQVHVLALSFFLSYFSLQLVNKKNILHLFYKHEHVYELNSVLR